jgi:hypothetical protein
MTRVTNLLTGLIAAVAIGCSVGPGGSQSPPTGKPTAEPSNQPELSAISSAASLLTCDETPTLTAPASAYRDSPIYAGNPDDEVMRLRQWAATKPGFQDLWIDRDHLGWITLAFSADAAARQAELESELPDIGAVAVQVPWTEGELLNLQRRLRAALLTIDVGHATGTLINKGVVSAEVGYLTPDVVALLNREFAGEPVCISGQPPELAPVEGPQPTAGLGWRLLTDQDETGESYRTAIAYDDESYDSLWRSARLTGEPPPVDFDSEVAIWFGAVHGSSCPRLRLDDVVIDEGARLVYSEITDLDRVGACTADAIPHAYVVALERSLLPGAPFTIQLSADPAVDKERTTVEVDLSAPGSTADTGDIHGEQSHPEEPLGPGAIVELGFVARYRQSTHCGLEWIGPINNVYFRTDSASGVDWVPSEWQDYTSDGTITLDVLLNDVRPKPTLEATAGHHTVTYSASSETAPGCD